MKSTLTILILDTDIEEAQGVLRDLASVDGTVCCLTCTDHKQALSCTRNGRPDVLIIQRNSHYILNDRLLNAVKAEDSFRSTPVLCLFDDPYTPTEDPVALCRIDLFLHRRAITRPFFVPLLYGLSARNKNDFEPDSTGKSHEYTKLGRHVNEIYRAVYEQSPIGIAIADSDSGEFYSINPKFAEMTGRTVEELYETDWMSITHPDDIGLDMENMAHMNAGLIDNFTMDKRYIRPDNSVVWISMTISRLAGFSSKRRCHLCMTVDIQEKKEREHRIEYLSYRDSLTDLYNRAYFVEQVTRLDSPEYLPLSVIIGDINGLKIVNDTLGHAGGDKLLSDMATILKTCCRKDDVVARVGGDEFSILLPHTGCEEVCAVTERIYAACEDFERTHRNESKHGGIMRIALGYATKTDTSENFESVSRIAEDNMYRRKLLEREALHNSIVTSIRTVLTDKGRQVQSHDEGFADIVRRLARLLDVPESDCADLDLLASLHDIGKISIEDSILSKPKNLTDTEWHEIKKHPTIGYRIAMASPELESIADAILCHQEKWDGSGYPQGISGEDIPLFSRIIAVVDAYDAMICGRPYRKPLSVEQALLEIKKNAGTQFDPCIADAFVDMISREIG